MGLIARLEDIVRPSISRSHLFALTYCELVIGPDRDKMIEAKMKTKCEN